MEPAAGDDGELLRLVRAGEDAAFGELFVRHSAAVRGYALRCCADAVEAEDMAAEAFFRAFQAIRRGAGPADNVRAYLLTVVRRLAAEWSGRRRDVPVAADELGRQLDAGRDAGYVARPSVADLQLIATAFTSLPQRWRAVLWRVEVEGQRPAVVAAHFGLSANATAALARRARKGLRAAYLQAHVGSGGGHGCQAVVAKLGAFTAGQVTGAEDTRIRHHLADCAPCQRLHAELRDVCAGLRRHATATRSATQSLPVGAVVGLGKAGLAARLLGHVAATGLRAKLGVAAVSVAAVGGFGVVAVPVLAHIDPSPPVADRGVTLGPTLTTTGVPAFPLGVPPRRIEGVFAAPTAQPRHLRREDDGPAAEPRSATATTEQPTEPTTEPATDPGTAGPMSAGPQQADGTAGPEQPPDPAAPMLDRTPSVTSGSTTAVTPISPGPTSDALVP